MDTYDRFLRDDLILRDELAIDRTLLANERTLLSYARSGLAAVVGGITFMHFPEEGVLFYMGAVLIPVGLIMLGVGYHRYVTMRRSIEKVRRTLRTRDGA